MPEKFPEVNMKTAQPSFSYKIDHYALIVAQGSGTATEKVIIEDIDESEVDTILGSNSLATLAVKKFKEHNPFTRLDVCPLKEGTGGVKAKGGITVTGTAKESKTLVFQIADDSFEYTAEITKDDTNIQIAQKIYDAVHPNLLFQPFDIEIDSTNKNVLHLTAKVQGIVNNGLNVNIETRISGVSITPVAFTGGSGAYDFEGILENTQNPYGTIIFDACVSIDAISGYLNKVYDIEEGYRIGASFIALNDGETNLKLALLFSTNGADRKCVCCVSNPPDYKTTAIPILLACEYGAIHSLRLLEGANIKHLVTNPDVDGVGGPQMCTLPYHNTPLSYKAPKGQLDPTLRKELELFGVNFLVKYPRNKAKSAIGGSSTLALQSREGDNNLNLITTRAVLLKDLYTTVLSQYEQSRASGTSTVAGVATKAKVQASIMKRLKDLQKIPVVSTEDDSTKRIDATKVEFNRIKGKFEVSTGCLPVGQFLALDLTLNMNEEG